MRWVPGPQVELTAGGASCTVAAVLAKDVETLVAGVGPELCDTLPGRGDPQSKQAASTPMDAATFRGSVLSCTLAPGAWRRHLCAPGGSQGVCWQTRTFRGLLRGAQGVHGSSMLHVSYKGVVQGCRAVAVQPLRALAITVLGRGTRAKRTQVVRQVQVGYMLLPTVSQQQYWATKHTRGAHRSPQSAFHPARPLAAAPPQFPEQDLWHDSAASCNLTLACTGHMDSSRPVLHTTAPTRVRSRVLPHTWARDTDNGTAFVLGWSLRRRADARHCGRSNKGPAHASVA